MAVVINFIIDKFVWFMCGAIIIILAIIGSYADKTNFGEGKKIVKVKKKNKDIIDSLDVKEKDDSSEASKSIEDEVDVSKDTSDNTGNEIKIDSNNVDITENVESAKDMPILEVEKEDKHNETEHIEEEKSIDKEKEISVIDEIIEENKEAKEELDELLPKKDVLDDDIFQDLGDLDDIKFDTKKKKINEIPDLDDVFLPDITKKKKSSKQIWKK